MQLAAFRPMAAISVAFRGAAQLAAAPQLLRISANPCSREMWLV